MSHKDNSPNVSVICRFRPMNELEKANGNEQIIEFTSPTSLTFNSFREKNSYRFNFDRIFDPNTTQKEVYDFGVKGIIDSVLDGYNGTVLAYGQTSSGKTYTMEGKLESETTKGIIPRMIDHVFDHITSCEGIDFMLKVSFVEIYQEKVRDLLEPERVNLNIREDNIKGIFIEGVSENYIGSPVDVIELMELGSQNRAQAATNMNEHSSRSHSIFILTVMQSNKKEGYSKTGKLYLVDLAGSEKISKTGATGHTLEEAKIINKSLTTLGRVINSLTDGKSTHIPYRESKLTRILQESLGGNSKTCLIITCSPSIYNEAESLSTLRFGERAKKIKNKPKINKEYTVEELTKRIAELEAKLRKAERRIAQLENYIRNHGLEVPPGDYEMELEMESKSKKEKEEKEEKKDKERKILDPKEIQELKEKYTNEGGTILDHLNNVLTNIEETEDLEEIKADILAQLEAIKEKYLNKEEEDKNKLASLQDELTNSIEMNAKLQKDLIDLRTKMDENPTKPTEPSITIKTFNELGQTKDSFNITHIPKQVETTGMQTEKAESEIEKITEKFMDDKRVLMRAIDEKTEMIERLLLEKDELNERIKNYENNMNTKEKDVKNKNTILEANLKDLRKKYEKACGEKLLLEDQTRNLKKVLKEKLKELEDYGREICDLKEKVSVRNPINTPNMIKVIQGGATTVSKIKVKGSCSGIKNSMDGK